MAGSRASDRRLGLVESLTAVAAVALGVLGVVFSESIIIGAVVAFGPLGAFGLLFFGCSGISMFIAYAFDAEEAHRGVSPLVGRVRAWIARKRGAVEARAERVAHLSEAVAFVVMSVTVGPFLTTVAVKLRGGAPRPAYLLSLLSSAIFSAVWVTVYAGGIAVVRQALGR